MTAMSTPSTPHSMRTASPPGDSEILTPGRKIRAMLAQFDDSESEDENAKPASRPSTRPTTDKNNPTNNPTRTTTAPSDDEGDEDDDIVMPKGRMAARMQGQNEERDESEYKKKETALGRVSKTLRAEKDDDEGEEDDDLPAARPRRSFAKGENTAAADDEEVSDRSPSSAHSRSFSPLFMSSPTAQRQALNDEDKPNHSAEDSDDEEPQPKNNGRLQALIAQKRKEREGRERVEAEKKAAACAARHEQFSSEILSGGETGDDDGAGASGSRRKLTKDSARPAARKASKKALEEMNRETQRMSRDMQLTHQEQTKKKITKESFLARFNNFGQQQQKQAQQSASGPSSSQASADSQNSSDVDMQKDHDTPRTSPVLEPVDKPSISGNDIDAAMEPTPIEQVLAGAHLRPNDEEPIVARAEIQANEPSAQAPAPNKSDRKTPKKAPVRVRLSRQSVAEHQQDDSDSDLEVITSIPESRRIAAFENLPTKKMEESTSMMRLRALAHLASPSRKHASMDLDQLNAHLLARARQQAAGERKERIEELRAKGIAIETTEERAAMEDEIENLVEKARKEADDIAKKERKDSKKESGEDGDDDEGDADFELSGSEDEEGQEVDEEEKEDVDQQAQAKNDEGGLFDSEAGEDEESADEQSEAVSADEADQPTARRKRPTRVVSDDEDEEEPKAPATPVNPITSNKGSAQRLEFPGMPGSADLTMGLTQAFVGTLGASHQGSRPTSPSIIPTLPDPTMGGNAQSESQVIVRDSQGQPRETTESMDIFANYVPPAPSDAGALESPAFREMSEFSQIPEPSQDAGFVLSPFDPTKRFLDEPPSTVETVLLGRGGTQSPIKQRKHLRRGRADHKPTEETKSEGDFEVDASAFDVLKTASKEKSRAAFDKKNSKAKDVVEEAAEESDDEYAGLGGGSDDDDGEEDTYDSTMINDDSGEAVDEKQLAALNAMHQRNADEQQVAKLLQDITTGALRRRRGADDDFDLDDPADELLARRREKQRENARMRRALLADEKVNEIAENPKKAAFFKAIEDRDDEDDVDLDFLEYCKENGGSQDSVSPGVGTEGQKGDGTAPQDNNTEGSKRKRPLEPSAEDIANRPPPHLRRTPASAMSKKPQSLTEIRETLSFLTERPEYDSFHEDAAIEEDHHHHETGPIDDPMDEDELESAPKDDFTPPLPPHLLQHPRRNRNTHVVDRLALLRQASSNSAKSASASSTTRFAFQTNQDPASNIGFKPPPFLRKAATNSSSSSSSSISSAASESRKLATKASAGGGTKTGAVNYYTAAREREREREIRAKERSSGSNIKALLSRHGANRLGSLGKGQWE